MWQDAVAIVDWSAPIWYASGYIRDPAFIVA